jgi:hypothetical protein
MHSGKLVFAQLMEHLPLHTFRRCVAKYPSRYPTLTFSHLDQFLCMAFAQLTFRESLRDIETCLRAHSSKLYHLGIRGGVARSTLADANETRDWRIYQDFAMSLIRIARKLYAHDSFAVELDNTVYALDTTTIEMSMSLFPWAHYGGTHAAVKLHTLLDLRGNIPSFLYISGAKTGELTVFDQLLFEPGSFYILDRASSITRACIAYIRSVPTSSCEPDPICSSHDCNRITSINPAGCDAIKRSCSRRTPRGCIRSRYVE